MVVVYENKVAQFIKLRFIIFTFSGSVVSKGKKNFYCCLLLNDGIQTPVLEEQYPGLDVSNTLITFSVTSTVLLITQFSCFSISLKQVLYWQKHNCV